MIKIRVLRKVFSKQFCFIRCRRQHLWIVGQRRCSRYTFVENTISNSPKVWEANFWEVMDSLVLLAYASLAASRTLLQQLLACLNFTLESEDFSLWYKRKKWFLWTMAAAQAAENHKDEWGLTWYLGWGIYTSIRTWTYPEYSLAAALSIWTCLKLSQRSSQSAQE